MATNAVTPRQILDRVHDVSNQVSAVGANMPSAQLVRQTHATAAAISASLGQAVATLNGIPASLAAIESRLDQIERELAAINSKLP
jgi:hypothetical protein